MNAEDVVSERLGEWQTRLLQLNRRNNLLYFKPGRSAVGITNVGLDELNERIGRSRIGLAFPYMRNPPRRRRGFQPPDSQQPPEKPQISPGDLTTDCDVSDLQRRLRNLRRRDREWEEEQGLNVLFLAMGFLNWIDADGESARSPLILIPCDLDRPSPRDPYRLLREDDDPIVNPTLRHQLSLLSIELPAFRAEFGRGTEPIAAYVAEVNQLAGGREDWSVNSDIFLGVFSYSKLAMYEDLTRMRETGVRNQLTRLLAGGLSASEIADPEAEVSIPSEKDLPGGRLDDLLDIRDQYTVLPTDFSQLGAIEQARRGGQLVIHGPPGTGKSQTIVNLIATFLADGKRVLFVSEKTAALDVVKRRLEECGLGVFCLDLHSDRGRKTEVYNQLRNALVDSRDSVAAPISMEDLIEHRDRLNRIARLLHRRREPLGESVYEVQGRFAALLHLPRLDLDKVQIPPATHLTADWVREVTNAARRIANRPNEFRENHTSCWMPLRARKTTLQLTDSIREDMNAVQSAIDKFHLAVAPHTAWLKLPAIRSAGEARRLKKMLRSLSKAPGVPAAWLDRKAWPSLRMHAREQEAQQGERQRLDGVLSGWFGSEPPAIDYRAISKETILSPGEQELFEEILGSGWWTAIGNPVVLSRRTAELQESLDQVLAAVDSITKDLPGQNLRTLDQLDQALTLSARILGLDPVPERWLSRSESVELERKLREAWASLIALGDAEEQLGKQFSAPIVAAVNEELLVRYRTDYQSRWRRFGGDYRRDRRIVQGQMKAPRKLSLDESLGAIELALDVKRQQEQWSETEAWMKGALGDRYRSRKTDWGRVLTDLTTVRELLAIWSGPTAILRDLLAAEADGSQRRSLESARHQLEESLLTYRTAAIVLNSERLIHPALEVAALSETVRLSLVPLLRVRRGTAPLYRHLARQPADFDDLTGLIDTGVKLMVLEEEDKRLAPGLVEEFGPFFDHDRTDWSIVSEALDWAEEFFWVTGGRIGDGLRHHATDPQPSDVYETHLAEVAAATVVFTDALRMLDLRFDVGATEWDSWDEPTLADLQAWATLLHDHAGYAPAWVEYQEAVHDFSQLVGGEAIRAVRSLTEQAEEVPGIVQRAIYEAWLDRIYGTDRELGRFNRIDQEEVRALFLQLDERFPTAARQRVRERVFEGYPDQHTTPLQAGQLGTLNGELSKRRRQLPVRQLISRVPVLLQALKPCFLMSPLAVSQYLPGGSQGSGAVEFDVVIFDEASQVLPEDAIPAIERGRQVIVIGDRRQLPPTTFFQGGLGSDDDSYQDGEESEDSFEGRESILDVMVGQVGAGVAERYLSVHYRSRCESLIRFSNRAFYDSRLLTFPGPTLDEVGVQDVYLPGAIYDAGGSRTNRGEAERVTEIVFEMMESQPPDETIGVVALSRPQADLIENLIDERRLWSRHLDQRFSEDLHERFFVKNLENVQGDERDHMILSIGYGPTASGGVPNRFGPINQEGGERRLNVAVTRARKSMTVVHSLKAEDITSRSAGARQLRRYLEYVRNPDRALDAEVTGTGEPEGPFEEAVREVLRSRGHIVESQVGVSGYRIDLAIRSEDGNRFDLGIECDGATYHSSPAARDRDWQRQRILEGLGWRIHRVWSTAWIRSPEKEIDEIEQALEMARSGSLIATAEEGDNAVRDRVDPPPDISPESAPAVVAVPPQGRQSQLFNEYRYFECAPRSCDLLTVPPNVLATLIRRIVEVEGPAHFETVVARVRTAYSVSRAGSRIRGLIKKAIEGAVARKELLRLEGEGEFLSSGGGIEPPIPRLAGQRPIRHIAGVELDEGLLIIARKTFGSSRRDLLRETARQLGFNRTGADIAGRLGMRVDQLVESGRLLQRGDMLVAADDRAAQAARS